MHPNQNLPHRGPSVAPVVQCGETRIGLQARHDELEDRLQRIERDRRRMTQPLPQDFADQGIVRENDEVLDRLAETTASELAQVTRALVRFDAGLYGQCERCGARIASSRLDARPEATFCRDCAESG
jgi:DnaK suppressor protein